MRAADAALAEASALSAGLEGVADAMGDRAQRLVEDVAAAHERLSAQLGAHTQRSDGQAAARGERSPRGRPRTADRPSAPGPAATARLSRAATRDGSSRREQDRGPLDVPAWVDRLG